MPLRITGERRPMKTTHIAPCGMNCQLCYATMRDKNRCPGCRGSDEHKPASCVRCRIRNCGRFTRTDVRYCFCCDIYPCARLKHFDKRYRTRYGMSMLENLSYIQQHGIRAFVRHETARWTCPSCGTTLCVHRAECPECGHAWR